MKGKIGTFLIKTLAFVGLLLTATMASAEPATRLEDLSDLSIALGEQVDFSSIIDGVILDGEPATVTPNFPDTSILASGRHLLVYTAMTFSGEMTTKAVNLDVENATPLNDPPTISGVANHTFSQGRLFDLLKGVSANSIAGEPLVCTANIPYPEHLALGTNTIYFTTVDVDGKSAVASATLTVLPIEEKFRKAEWARLGNFLYEKYFEPARLTPYMREDIKIIKSFSYSPTEHGIVADIAYHNVEFDMLSFDPIPMKVEPLTARMLLLLRELHHHRYLWQDQEKIIFEIATRGVQSGTGNIKERGLYSVYIPVDVFKEDDFDQTIIAALQSLSEMPTTLTGRVDGKGKISHKLYEDPTSGIKILFMVDLVEGFASNYNTQWYNGEVTLEENFDIDMLKSEYTAVCQRFDRHEFGCFTNPKLPFIKQQHPNP